MVLRIDAPDTAAGGRAQVGNQEVALGRERDAVGQKALGHAHQGLARLTELAHRAELVRYKNLALGGDHHAFRPAQILPDGLHR